MTHRHYLLKLRLLIFFLLALLTWSFDENFGVLTFKNVALTFVIIGLPFVFNGRSYGEADSDDPFVSLVERFALSDFIFGLLLLLVFPDPIGGKALSVLMALSSPMAFFMHIRRVRWVFFMNLSLANNSVGFYQISKLACIPVTLFIQAKYFNTQHTDNVKMTLIPILFGVGLTTVTDFDVNLVGSCYAGVGVSFTVLGQVYTSTKQKELKMNSLQLLYHTAPLIAVGMAVMVPMFDSIAGPAGLSNFLSFDMTVGNYPKP